MKHKKLFALLLALVMLLSLMPMTVLAADAPTMYMRYPEWTVNGPTENTSKLKVDSITSRPGEYSNCYFYLGSSSGEERIDPARLSSSDESIVKVSASPDTPGMAFLEFVGFGDAVLTYTENGATYTFPVSIALPDVHFYSEPMVSQENYLKSFTVTKDDCTLYVVPNSGMKLSSAELTDGWPTGTTLTVSADKTYATIQVGDDAFANDSLWPSVRCYLEGENGNLMESNIGLELINGMPALFFYDVWYSDSKPVINEEFRRLGFITTPGSYIAAPRFGGADDSVKVDPAKLSSTNEDVVKIVPHEGSDEYVDLQFVGFGTAAIHYTHTDGKTYSVSVTVNLPDIAFYTKPVAAEGNYIMSFHATETNDTVYLVARNGYSVKDLRLEGFPAGSTFTLNADNTIATVQLGHQQAMEWVWANFTAIDPMGYAMEEWGTGFDLTTEFPGLFFYYGVPDENGGIQKDDTYSHYYWYTSPGTAVLYPMFFDGTKTTPVDPAALGSTNEDVVKLCISDQDAAAIQASFVGFGDASIEYTHTDGKTYAPAVRVMLPEVSLYSKPEATEDNYLWGFALSETNDTMYLVAHNGFSITDAQLHRFPEGSTITMNADNTVGTIKVAHAAMEETEAVVSYSAVTADGIVFDGWYSNITITSTIPAPECQHSWADGTILTAPTCTADGTKQLNCGLCGESKTEAIPAKGHAPEAIPAKAATCTEAGLTEGSKCSVCGEVLTAQKEIPANGHTEVIDAAVAATCTAAGKTEGKHCSVCNEVIVKQEAVPENGHKDADGNFACDVCGTALCTEHTPAAIPAKAATCTETGLTEGSRCSNCGKILTAQKEIPANGHTEVIDAAVAATCTAAGKTEGKHCSVCNEVIVKQEAVPALQHSYADGKCGVCGAKDPDYVPEPIENPFKDVSDTAWYVQPVLWAVQNNVTGGIGDGQFGPDVGCTRGQVVTFLWAAAGRPEPKSLDNPFTDVSESDYFYKAVLWAVENNITGGVGEGLFGPHNTCTRGQIVTFLWASQGKPEVSAVSEFTDVADTDWYAKPVMWAAQNGVTGGIGQGLFGPNETCTRGQVVTFLYKVYG